MTATDSIADLIVETPGTCGGRPRIAGHRITVANVAVWHDRMGLGADEICSEYGLTLGEVYAALAYYFQNRARIDRDLAEGAALVDEMERANTSPVAEKLKRLRSA